MRAVQIQEFGGPEVLEVVDLPRPEPGDGEVLIEVARAGLNFGDTHQRENTYLAQVRGAARPRGRGGRDHGGRTAGRRDGPQRRLCPVRGRSQGATTFPLPDGLDYDAALALLVQGLTAWHLYRTSAKLTEGESVVVISGAGGVGSLAVQLGKPFGAGRVIATASSEEKRRHTLELGADAAVDTGSEDLTAAILEANGGEPVDVVLEMAGGQRLRPEPRGPGAVRPARDLRNRRPRAERAQDRSSHAQEPRSGRLLAHALPRPPRHDGGAPGRPLRARRQGGAPAADRRAPILCQRSAAPTRTSWAAVPAGSSFSIPPPDP